MLLRVCYRAVREHLRIDQRCAADGQDDQHSGQKRPPAQLFLIGMHALRRDAA